MTINQLFKSKPPKDLVEELLQLCGINGFNDTKYFSRNDLVQLNVLDKLDDFINNLKQYYLPCKQKIYLQSMNYKKLITLLRQCIKLYGYKLISKEKYLKGEKIIIYQIDMIDSKVKTVQNTVCTLTFD